MHACMHAFMHACMHACTPGAQSLRLKTAVSLGWSFPREIVLLKYVEHDLRQKLVEALLVLPTLRSGVDQIRRGILLELMQRGLYLHKFAAKHGHIAALTTPDQLVQRAESIILDSVPSDFVRETHGIDCQTIVDDGMRAMSWPKLRLQLVIGSEEHIELALSWHLTISIRMATHLKGEFEHTFRTQCWGGALLSSQAGEAQAAARKLHRLLVSTRTEHLNPCVALLQF